jgi:PAS domain S-box-containing protein
VVSATASVITIGDAKARFCSPQQSWQRFTGQTWEQQRGWNWQFAIHPEDRASLWRQWQVDAPAGRVVEGEVRLWHAPEAAYRSMQLRAVPIKGEDGKVLEWVGAFIDIEDHVRSEQIHRRLVSILETTTDLVGTAEPGGRVLYLNRAARKMIGLNESADVTGTQIRDYHPSWVFPVIEEAIRVAQAEGVWRGETALRSATGKEIPV